MLKARSASTLQQTGDADGFIRRWQSSEVSWRGTVAQCRFKSTIRQNAQPKLWIRSETRNQCNVDEEIYIGWVCLRRLERPPGLRR